MTDGTLVAGRPLRPTGRRPAEGPQHRLAYHPRPPRTVRHTRAEVGALWSSRQVPGPSQVRRRRTPAPGWPRSPAPTSAGTCPAGRPSGRWGHHGEGTRGRVTQLNGLHGHGLGVARSPARATVMQQFARRHMRHADRSGVDLYPWFMPPIPQGILGERRTGDETRVASLIMPARVRDTACPGRGGQPGDEGGGERAEALHGCRLAHASIPALSGAVQVPQCGGCPTTPADSHRTASSSGPASRYTAPTCGSGRSHRGAVPSPAR